jgi:hypothetical protein
MALLVRDNRVITFSLRDGAPTTGPLNAMPMTGDAGYFTESVDIGTFSEGILFLLVKDAVAGTLDVNIQYSADNKNFIDSGDSLAQVTNANGLTIKKLTANFGKYVRCRLKIATAGSYTVTLQLVLKG